jgi:hypothetical protein
MKTIFLFTLILFSSCFSKLDTPKNINKMLRPAENPKLKIAVEAFLENPINKGYLDTVCLKAKLNENVINFTKDSTAIQLQNHRPKHVAILSKGQFLNYGLEIGMTKTEFLNTFFQLMEMKTEPYIFIQENQITLSNTNEDPNKWTFIFEKNRLKRVAF